MPSPKVGRSDGNELSMLCESFGTGMAKQHQATTEMRKLVFLLRASSLLVALAVGVLWWQN